MEIKINCDTKLKNELTEKIHKITINNIRLTPLLFLDHITFCIFSFLLTEILFKDR